MDPHVLPRGAGSAVRQRARLPDFNFKIPPNKANYQSEFGRSITIISVNPRKTFEIYVKLK